MNLSQIDQFWDRYIEKVIQAGNKEKKVRWFVIRAETYIRSIPEKELMEHNPIMQRWFDQMILYLVSIKMLIYPLIMMK